jgi:hypothetical protein
MSLFASLLAAQPCEQIIAAGRADREELQREAT